MALALLAIAIAPAGASSGSTDRANRVLASAFDVGTERGEIVEAVPNDGDAGGTGIALGKDGGVLVSGRRPSRDPTISFPRFGAERAVLSFGDRAAWSPHARRFSFAASFVLYPGAWRTSGTDNGNNLIQRGLSRKDAAHQYKIELDPRRGAIRPACHLRGSAGGVTAHLSTAIAPWAWYRVRCERTGTAVVLTLWRLAGGTLRRLERVHLSDSPGDVDPNGRLTVGGKAGPRGIETQTDQLNGAVDDIRMAIAP